MHIMTQGPSSLQYTQNIQLSTRALQFPLLYTYGADSLSKATRILGITTIMIITILIIIYYFELRFLTQNRNTTSSVSLQSCNEVILNVSPPLCPQQSKLVMDGFRSLKEGEQVEFTYKKSSKGLESLRVTGPGGGPCAGSERRPKGKVLLQKRKPKGDR